MAEPPTCVHCGKPTPEVRGEDTLTKVGWRARRKTAKAGTFELEWRCAACWKIFKAENAGD